MSHSRAKILARKDRRRARDRDEVLESAARLFAESGYSKTGMAEVADAADFSVGKLYTLYANKESLFAALIAARTRRMEDASAMAVDPRARPLDQLRQRMHGALDYFANDPYFQKIFMNEYPAVAEGLIHEVHLRHHKVTTEMLATAMAAGDIVAEPPEPLASLINSAVTGLIELAESRGEPVEVDPIMDYIERFFLTPLEVRTR